MIFREGIPGSKPNPFEGAVVQTRRFSYADPISHEELNTEMRVAVLDVDGRPSQKREYPVSWAVSDRSNRPHHSTERQFQKFSDPEFPVEPILPTRETTNFANGDTQEIEIQRNETGREEEGTERWNGQLTYRQRKQYDAKGNLVGLEEETHYRDTGRLSERRTFRATHEGVWEQSFYEHDGKEVTGEKRLRPSWRSGAAEGRLTYLGRALI